LTPPRLDGIVLDLDDTLLDTTGLLLPVADRRAIEAMRRTGLALGADDALAALHALRAGGAYEDLFARLAHEHGASRACGAAGAQAWFEYEVPPLELDPRVASALDELAHLAPLALLTFGIPATQRQKVDRLGIADRFVRSRYVDKDGGEDKRGGLADLLSATGWAASRVVMVGDSLLGDIAAGLAAGCLTVWVDGGGERSSDAAPGVAPWRTIRHVGELAAVLRAG